MARVSTAAPDEYRFELMKIVVTLRVMVAIAHTGYTSHSV